MYVGLLPGGECETFGWQWLCWRSVGLCLGFIQTLGLSVGMESKPLVCFPSVGLSFTPTQMFVLLVFLVGGVVWGWCLIKPLVCGFVELEVS